MSVARMAGLSAEAREVETRAIALVKDDLEALVAGYRRRFGVVVGTDLAREMFPDYAASLASKLKFAVAVQRAAARVADEVFARIVSENCGGEAIFTAGGTGAGKTRSVASQAMSRSLIAQASLVFDSNFNSLSSARVKLQAALDAGPRVTVLYVHRHPVDAYLRGVLRRAMTEGRTVPIEGHLRMHKDARKTFLRVQRAFASDARVAFLVMNNTKGEGEAYFEDIASLQRVNYHQEELYNAILEGFSHAYRTGSIGRDLYDECCGAISSSDD